ncbi:MAG: hypothetical protein IJM15_06255 [Erysipelotrichaceae bacterium]|nr:hypothetical protein [Erysipelotrichaceae bacterium]
MSENVKTIGKHYSLKQLIAFVLPAVINEFMISCLYTVDDGLFITRFVGTTAESAFSILMPLFMMHGALSSLLAGVAVVVARKMGEKKDEEARGDFTSILIVSVAAGIIIGAIEFIFKDQILVLLGATDIIFPYAKSFLSVSCFYVPLTMAGNLFARFYVTAGAPKMELFSTLMNVGSNVILDWYFVVYRRIGMIGTAYANLIATIIQVAIGLIFYSSERAETGFGRPSSDVVLLIFESCGYGFSQFLSNMAVGAGYIVSNYALLTYGNEAYLAAYTIVNNIGFTFISAYFGLFGAAGPLLSYASGERNEDKINHLFKTITAATMMLSAATIILFICFSGFLTVLFTGKAAADIKDLIHYGLSFQPYGFVFFGCNVGVSKCLTSLGNIKAASIITIMQEVVFSNLMVILLPALFGINGVWFSFMAGNAATFIVTLIVLYASRRDFGFGRNSEHLIIEQ